MLVPSEVTNTVKHLFAKKFKFCYILYCNYQLQVALNDLNLKKSLRKSLKILRVFEICNEIVYRKQIKITCEIYGRFLVAKFIKIIYCHQITNMFIRHAQWNWILFWWKHLSFFDQKFILLNIIFILRARLMNIFCYLMNININKLRKFDSSGMPDECLSFF